VPPLVASASVAPRGRRLPAGPWSARPSSWPRAA